MKKTTQNLAAVVDTTHSKLQSARSQTKRCKKMYLNAKTAEAEAEVNFRNAKDALEQNITETN